MQGSNMFLRKWYNKEKYLKIRLVALALQNLEDEYRPLMKRYGQAYINSKLSFKKFIKKAKRLNDASYGLVSEQKEENIEKSPCNAEIDEMSDSANAAFTDEEIKELRALPIIDECSAIANTDIPAALKASLNAGTSVIYVDAQGLYSKKSPYKALIDILSAKANAALPAILQASLDAGVPITYRDDQGRYVKEMPNGEIIVLEENVK